jgi:sulfide:quinone oxidoreductase
MQVVVAGGGIAALEAIAGMRALAGDRVAATLLAPERSFSYRPLSTAVPFAFGKARTRSLRELVGGLGADFMRDGLAQVDMARRRVLTHAGDFLTYDALVVAVGARHDYPAGGQAWGRGARRGARWAGLLREIEAGGVGSVAFVVPRRAGWPVDAYELSLVAAVAAQRARPRPKLCLLTAEDVPLESFGPAVAETVRAELTRAGIELVTGVSVTIPAVGDEAGRDAFSSVVGRLARRRPQASSRDAMLLSLDPGSQVTVDRAVFLPAIRGPRVAGLPYDHDGFLPVDAHGRIPAVDGVYAAGDATPLSLKHSTLASTQAAAAAEAIAASGDATVDPGPWSPVLYGIFSAPPSIPGPPGSPWVREREPAEHCLWWPPGHVAGRYLAPYLASADRGIRPGLVWHPKGFPVAVEIEQRLPDTREQPFSPSEAALRYDAITRQLMAMEREAREGERLAAVLARRGREFERHEREVVNQLRAAGYLREKDEAGSARPGMARSAPQARWTS